MTSGARGDESADTADLVHLNGIDALTGQALVPPLSSEKLAELAGDESVDHLAREWVARFDRGTRQQSWGLPEGVSATSIREAGWAIVFHSAESDEVRNALKPLVEHRQQQIGDDARVKVLDYREGETGRSWLVRHGVGAGTVDPTKVPYYLLLIGSPERIPFIVGQHLDVEYAVGRLHFDDPADLAAYVERLLAYEGGSTSPRARAAVFFGPHHDPATALSSEHFLDPLARWVASPESGLDYHVDSVLADKATKHQLVGILDVAPERGPALLFTASHGVGYPRGHGLQRAKQGALLCHGWPGSGAVADEDLFAGSDVPPSEGVTGVVTFHFACYGAGTPAVDRFIHTPGEMPPRIADQPFIAALPMTLLAHGALACIGHVERAWGHSFMTPGAGDQLQPFRNVIARILRGLPVGYATTDLNERYAALSTDVAALVEDFQNGKQGSSQELAAAWPARNDAEGYVVLGDPAVCVRVGDLRPVS